MNATLQVPLDVRFARYTLRHLVRRWGSQVEEVLLVVDPRESPFRARSERADTARAHAELDDVIGGLEHPRLRVVEVNASMSELAAACSAA